MGIYQETLFCGNIARIGTFSAPTDGPRFTDTGPTGGHLIVFPRIPVLITHADGKPVTASPNVVMFYNHRQEYSRKALSPAGDRCHWFGFDEKVLQGILQTNDASIQDHPQRPFQLTHGPSTPQIYALQRMLIEYLLRHPHPDPLFVEEIALALLSSSVRSGYKAWYGPDLTEKVAGKAAGRGIAQAVEQVLARRFRERLTLDVIAAEVQYSPFHMSHIFFQQTGQTVHQYLNQLRLRTAYDLILAGEKDFSRLAFEIGFSSHSHFTSAFRRAFGTQPSNVRTGNFRQLEKIASF